MKNTLGNLQNGCLKIADLCQQAGGRALLVGGCVRDYLLKTPAKDIDIEVFGIDATTLERLLKEHFKVDLVGKSFGVLKLRQHPIDVSLPREESKIGLGHQGFEVKSDPHLNFAQAARRRDFTINAMGYDLLEDKLIDPYSGKEDLENKILRHVSEQFSEDPLRILRAMQFIGRFELKADPQTLELCKKINPENLSKERIFGEWEKLIIQASKPSLGLEFLKACNWVKYYPALEALIGCEQDRQWHPEGDVWTHTLHCLDAFAKERIHDRWEDLIVGLSVLCHDMGKPLTTIQTEDGRIRSPRHEVEGEKPARNFLGQMTEHKDLIEAVIPLVLTHMRPLNLYNMNASDTAIRRLAVKVRRIDRLVRLCSADAGGRPPLTKGEFKEGPWLLERARQLNIQAQVPQPLVMGRHLIELGMRPGIEFKEILKYCYEAQLEGKFGNKKKAKQFLFNYLKEK